MFIPFFITQAEAKKFFIERITAQAAVDEIALSEAERQMLAWSEAEMPFETALQLQNSFEAETTDAEFEVKIAALIRQAYVRDISLDPDAKKSYRAAYRVLQEGDHYILIMIDKALGFRLKSWWPF